MTDQVVGPPGCSKCDVKPVGPGGILCADCKEMIAARVFWATEEHAGPDVEGPPGDVT